MLGPCFYDNDFSFQVCSSQDFFQGGVFNSLHLHAKTFFFKRFKSSQKFHFFMKQCSFLLK
jgi:hypothetical protein